MNAELYLKKAVLQLSKGLEEKSIESLNKVLETGADDQVSLIKAHLSYINDIYENSDEEFDDVLNDEFFEADILTDMIERFRFLRE